MEKETQKSINKITRTERLQIIIPVGIFVCVLFMIFLSKKIFIPQIKRNISYDKTVNNRINEGDLLYFGDDEFNNSWRVLKIEGNKALLINEKCIQVMNTDGYPMDYILNINGCMVYHPNTDESVYEGKWDYDKYLDGWLNEKYFQETFNAFEQKLICDSEIGKIFLLSAEEAEKYFDDDEDRKTSYFKNSIPWWLRSTRECNSNIYNDYVNFDGKINGNGLCYPDLNIGIRPAMWVKLTK